VAANPSGSVHQVVEGYRHLANAKPVLVGGAAVVLVSYLLALVGVLDNWWFASITIATVFMLPVMGQWLMPEAVLGEEEAARRRPLIPERIGLDEPYSAEARDEIDRELGISDYLSTPPVRADKELVTNG
jgi:branched-chain amino acid transport system permease protein